jgi:hypothetical protein
MKDRRAVLILFVILLLLGGGLAWFFVAGGPPSDESVVIHFQSAKIHLEHLRQMLSDDTTVEVVAGYGVTTDKSIVAKPPTEVGMRPARYQEYMDTLGAAGASTAFHRDEEYKFGIGGRGFASHGWRLALIYRDSPPDPQEVIDSIDGFRPSGSKWRQGYRHLEGNWYIWIIW